MGGHGVSLHRATSVGEDGHVALILAGSLVSTVGSPIKASSGPPPARGSGQPWRSEGSGGLASSEATEKQMDETHNFSGERRT